LPNSI